MKGKAQLAENRIPTGRLFTYLTGVLVAALLLSGCGPAKSETEVPGTASPSAPPTSTPGVTAPAVGAPGVPLEDARAALAQALEIDQSEISVVSAEEVRWTDGCLEVELPGTQCTEVIVPGWRITLEARDADWVYHTNSDGSLLVPVPHVAVRWQDESLCQMVEVDYHNGVNYGECQESRTGAPFVDDLQPEDLGDFAIRYAPFRANTAVGEIAFLSAGKQPALPTTQRMLAEWARVTALEIQEGPAVLDDYLALSWHREGGIAGFCDDMELYLTGLVTVSECTGPEPVLIDRFYQDAGPLQQLYAWVDEFVPFDYLVGDTAVADALTKSLVFYGQGQTEATEADQQAVEAYAEQLFSQNGTSRTPSELGSRVPAAQLLALLQRRPLG
jgi:hypothetical protein